MSLFFWKVVWNPFILKNKLYEEKEIFPVNANVQKYISFSIWGSTSFPFGFNLKPFTHNGLSVRFPIAQS